MSRSATQPLTARAVGSIAGLGRMSMLVSSLSNVDSKRRRKCTEFSDDVRFV